MSCPLCPHCVGRGAFGLIDPNDPALTTSMTPAKRTPTLHKAHNGHFSECGVFAFRYKDRIKPSGAKSVDSWDETTCPRCLAKRPQEPT